jgi:hypothetical protein
VLYRLDEGHLRRSAAAMREAIDGLDPVWERMPLADALAEIARLPGSRSDPVGRRELLNRLYAIDPGALLQEGLGLPLVLRFSGAWTGLERRTVRRLLARSGSEIGAAAGEGFHYVLSLSRSEGGDVTITLAEADAAKPVVRAQATSKGGPRHRAADIVSAVLAECYAVE